MSKIEARRLKTQDEKNPQFFFWEKYDGLGLFFLENNGGLYFFVKKYDGPGLFFLKKYGGCDFFWKSSGNGVSTDAWTNENRTSEPEMHPLNRNE